MRFVRRLRRYSPGIVGLATAIVVLWRGAVALEREADSHVGEAFALRVLEPSVVLDTSDPAVEMQWHGSISPAKEHARIELRVDGLEQSASGETETGELVLPLERFREQPGWHFIELSLERRGGRDERVVDAILTGEFAKPNPEQTKPCAALLSLSPELIDSLVVPMLERELLPELQANEFMGPETEITTAEIELGEDSLKFELEVSGINTLTLEGTVLVTVASDRRLYTQLAALTKVEFNGKLRDQARGAGAGGGALVGGLLGGALAPVGAAAGWYAADTFVTRKARSLVRDQIVDALAELEQIDLLPTHIELIPGQAASNVGIGFCEQSRVRTTGIRAGLWIVPEPPSGAVQFELGVSGPLVTGSATTDDPLGPGEDVRIELSVDAVNSLLTSWTTTGLLTRLIGEERAVERANEELSAWTPLRLGQLRPTRPPAFTPIGGSTRGWRYGIGGLAIGVAGIEESAQSWGDIYLAAAGELSPTWDQESQTLSLSGTVDTLAVTCAKPADDDRGPILHGCFSDLLDAAEVRQRIDEQLQPASGKMPKLALGELLDEAIGLEIEGLSLSRPRAGLLRLSANVRPAEGK
jgi:hypothetical protein